VPLLTRGKSGYDAVLRWLPNTEPDLAGYAVMMRSTTSPVWESETWVDNVTTYTMTDVSIDDVVIGVKAVDGDGNQSVVSPYMEPVRSGPARSRPLQPSRDPVTFNNLQPDAPGADEYKTRCSHRGLTCGVLGRLNASEKERCQTE
jgi:hypothetical protein